MGGKCNGDFCEIGQEDGIDYEAVAKEKIKRWCRELNFSHGEEREAQNE